MISSSFRLLTRFSPGSSSILFTLNRTSLTVHRSLLGAKTTSPLRVRTKSCPSWRFSCRPMPTTAAIHRPEVLCQLNQINGSGLTSRSRHLMPTTAAVTDVHGMIYLWDCELWRLVEKQAELVSSVGIESVGWREREGEFEIR